MSIQRHRQNENGSRSPIQTQKSQHHRFEIVYLN
jgi:hypothetical protein